MRRNLQIMTRFSWQNGLSMFDVSWQQPCRVTDKSQFGCDVNQGGEHGIEHTEGGQAHADAVHQQGAHEVSGAEICLSESESRGLQSELFIRIQDSTIPFYLCLGQVPLKRARDATRKTSARTRPAAGWHASPLEPKPARDRAIGFAPAT